MVEYSASTARTLCGHVLGNWFGFQRDCNRNRSTREYSIRVMLVCVQYATQLYSRLIKVHNE